MWIKTEDEMPGQMTNGSPWEKTAEIGKVVGSAGVAEVGVAHSSELRKLPFLLLLLLLLFRHSVAPQPSSAAGGDAGTGSGVLGTPVRAADKPVGPRRRRGGFCFAAYETCG